MVLGGSRRAHLGRDAPTRRLGAARQSRLPALRHRRSTRARDPLPGSPDLQRTGYSIARDTPKPGGEIERVYAELRPEPGLAEEISLAVAAILPNRFRTA